MENENQNVNSEAENSKGTEQTKSEKVNYEELIKTDKELQSFLDSRVSSANKTAVENAKVKWEEDNKTKMAEAEKLAKMDEEEKAKYELEIRDKKIAEYEARENARNLKDEAINIATQKEIPIAYLDLFKFENMTAEEVKSAIDVIESLVILP